MFFLLAFSVIGQWQKRIYLLFNAIWLMAAIVHYGLIVLSAGSDPIIPRDDVVWMIRTSVYLEALTFAVAKLAFIAENINWKRPTGTGE